jgi:hypothetical protein
VKLVDELENVMDDLTVVAMDDLTAVLKACDWDGQMVAWMD